VWTQKELRNRRGGRQGGRAGWVAWMTAAVLLLAGLPGGVARAQEPAERLETVEQQVEALRQQVELLRQQLLAAEAARAAAEAAKVEAEAAAAAARALAADARAAEAKAREGGDLSEVERRLEVLAAEIERIKLGEAAAEADRAERGLGPAASKIYRTGSGLSIGGYGEMLYQGFDATRDDGAPSGRKDELDFLRAIVYFGYKFNDRWLFNSEIEFEHASTGANGEASVEFAYFDYLARPELNARVGLLLLPMGFINELHEPTVFLGTKRPDVERSILPTTWRENGFGLYGDVGPFTYRTYLVNGLDAAGFSSAGIRGGRQKGSEALAEDFAWVGRLDYTGLPGLTLGASAYLGDSGQGIRDPATGRTLAVGTTIYEGHLEWRARGLSVRALAARVELDDVSALNRALGLAGIAAIGEEMEGGYIEVGYDVLSPFSTGEKALIPYLRWEDLDTQAAVPAGFGRNPVRSSESFTLGLAFKPFDRFVIKADYQDYDNGAGTGVDQFNVAIGYVF